VERLNITLEDEYAEKLSRLAERTHVQPGTIARSLLSTALDEADADPPTLADLCETTPGTLKRTHLGREQAEAGETIPLEEL
jgi:predicted transcriptional regulator